MDVLAGISANTWRMAWLISAIPALRRSLATAVVKIDVVTVTTGVVRTISVVVLTEVAYVLVSVLRGVRASGPHS